jgi:sialidase-1
MPYVMRSRSKVTAVAHALLAVALALTACSHYPGPRPVGDGHVSTTTLFEAGHGGYHTYRIPALLRTREGTLLAFVEARRNGAGDSGDIDVLLRRSADEGKSWSPPVVVCDMGPNTCGNPTVVQDGDTGVIWLFMSWNRAGDNEAALVNGRGRDTRRVFLSSSSDDGVTWSEPVEVTDAVKDSSMTWYSTGPGVGIQLHGGPHAGRLLIPGDHTYPDPHGDADSGPYTWGTQVIVSDDHGRSWHLGGLVRPRVAEPQIAEVPGHPGRVVMNASFDQHPLLRAQSYSDDGGDSWSPPVAVPELVNPNCESSLIEASEPSSPMPFLLFANPASTRRVNLVVRRSDDGGATWSRGLLVHRGPAAYSGMAEIPPGRIAVLFETGRRSAYERIAFLTVPIDSIPRLSPDLHR